MNVIRKQQNQRFKLIKALFLLTFIASCVNEQEGLKPYDSSKISGMKTLTLEGNLFYLELENYQIETSFLNNELDKLILSNSKLNNSVSDTLKSSVVSMYQVELNTDLNFISNTVNLRKCRLADTLLNLSLIGTEDVSVVGIKKLAILNLKSDKHLKSIDLELNKGLTIVNIFTTQDAFVKELNVAGTQLIFDDSRLPKVERIYIDSMIAKNNADYIDLHPEINFVIKESEFFEW